MKEKEITIYQENSQPLHIIDKDESKINEYSKKLSTILEVSNVTILETSSGCVILRPHKISSIKVREVKYNIESDNTQNYQEEKTKDIKKISINEDIITDGD